MAIGDVLVRIRKERNLTQEDLARKLYVTRQAVSRWENGETTPGIDMCKLIAATCDVPVALLLEMPDGAYCQSCGMPFYQEKDHGTEADGSLSADYCSWCYANGAFLEDETLEELIERCAPFMAESCHITRDEAVSFMGACSPRSNAGSGTNAAFCEANAASAFPNAPSAGLPRYTGRTVRATPSGTRATRIDLSRVIGAAAHGERLQQPEEARLHAGPPVLLCIQRHRHHLAVGVPDQRQLRAGILEHPRFRQPDIR
ncbi:MAG: zinc ribbon domain-containing protein [Eggerthellaceae bacterium]